MAIVFSKKHFTVLTLGIASVFSLPELQPQTLAAQLVSPGGTTSVQILGGTAGYTSELWLYSPYSQYLGTNREVGAVRQVGNFAMGTELLFGIYVRNTGYRYLMGPGSNNPDGVVHALMYYISPGVVKVGFEDIFGGGDRRYFGSWLSTKNTNS